MCCLKLGEVRGLVVLVTGGSGFIGSHVVDAVKRQGLTVRVFDQVKPEADVEWIKGDLRSKEDTYNAVRDVETVFHLAAIADVNVAATDPQLCLDVNEMGTLNLLQASSGQDVERFVLASTVWVYGKIPGTVNEDTPIQPPADIYTKTKIGQEHLVHSWARSHSIRYTILRYDIPYGPRMRGNMAIAAFVRRAMNREPITIFGDGAQGRCWIYVTDLAQAHYQTLKADLDGQIINLAGRDFVTISQIVDKLKRKLGDFPVKHEAARPGDFSGVHTSIQKANNLLHWSPAVSFDDGLSAYIDDVQKGCASTAHTNRA
jgi:UDP-glucose 4-epimerase